MDKVEIRARIETIQMKPLLQSAKIQDYRRAEETCCHSDSVKAINDNLNENFQIIMIIKIKTQHNRKCWWLGWKAQLYDKRMQQMNAKEFKTRHDWVGKDIHKELSKKINLIIRKSVVCTTQNLSLRMKCTKSLEFCGASERPNHWKWPIDNQQNWREHVD